MTCVSIPLPSGMMNAAGTCWSGAGPCAKRGALLWGASTNGGGREGIPGSPGGQAQDNPKQGALELAKNAPERESTMGGREICL